MQQRGAAIIKSAWAFLGGFGGKWQCRHRSIIIVVTTRLVSNDCIAQNSFCRMAVMAPKKWLISGFPIRSKGSKWEIVQGVPINDFTAERIDETLAELKGRKSLVAGVIERLNRGPGASTPFLVAHLRPRVLAKTFCVFARLSLPAVLIRDCLDGRRLPACRCQQLADTTLRRQSQELRLQRCCRQAADNCRLAACAPQKKIVAADAITNPRTSGRASTHRLRAHRRRLFLLTLFDTRASRARARARALSRARARALYI